MTLKEVMGIPLIKPNYEDLKFLATLNQLLYVGQAVTTLLNRLRSFLVLLASSLVDREKKIRNTDFHNSNFIFTMFWYKNKYLNV